jgi:CHAT domain-containing protein
MAGRDLPGCPFGPPAKARGALCADDTLLGGLCRIAADVGDGIIDLAAARGAARLLDAPGILSAVDAVRDSVSAAVAGGRFGFAAVLSDLLNAALPLGSEAWLESGFGLLAAAPIAVVELPDGRWQRHLDEVAEELVAATFRTGDAGRMAQALLRAALATLTVYTQGKSSQAYPGQLKQWQIRMARTLGHELPKHRDPRVVMPDPAQALTRAATRAGAAARLSSGSRRGLALLAEVYAASFAAALGAEAVQPGARTFEQPGTLDEAATLLADDTDVVARILLADALAASGGSPLVPSCPPDGASLMTELGAAGALAVLARAAQVYWRAGDLANARPVAQAAARLAEDEGTEADRRLAWMMALHTGDTLVPCRGEVSDIAAAAADLTAATPPGTAPPTAAFAHLASHAGPGADLAVVLRLLDRAGDGAAVRFPRAARMLYEAGRPATSATAAVRAAAAAAEGFADLNLPDLVWMALGRIAQRAGADADSAAAAIESTAQLMPYTAVYFGEPAVNMLLRALRTALGYLAQVEVNAQLVFGGYQLAKGLWFGAERASRITGQQPWELESIPAPTAENEILSGAFDSEELTCACARTEEMLPGNTPAEVAINRQRAFDRRLAAVQLRHAAHAVAGTGLTRVDHVQRHLAAEDVLLCYYLGGATVDGAIMARTSITAITARAIEPMSISTPNEPEFIDLQDSLQTLRLHHIALNVAQLRREVKADPQFRNLTRECERTIADDTSIFLAPVVDVLSEWRASGHEHLVIWPHGPLHVLPFHLLGPRPLADEWVMTIVPEVRTLGAAPVPAPPGRLLSVGAPPEPAVSVQAVNIAELFGEPALTGAAATKTSLRAALPGTRYLHLAAHGTLNASAPSLACLYLTPDAGDDGRLFAYELASYDLRGVDLVTLSACESALGRVDIADNLTGVPAAMLRAGARTVIGCLWPVAPDAAGTFFTSLYAGLASGTRKLDAYRAAQLETRARFPQYWQWGAFCYLGEWRA